MKKGLNWIIIILVVGIIGVLVYMFFWNIPIEEIKLNKIDISLHIGESDIIIPSIFPGNATDKTIVWKSANDKIAEVHDGVIIAVNVGETDITAESKDGTVKASSHVKVLVVEVEKIELSKEKLELVVGERQVLKANVLPTNATYPEIFYQSSNPSVVSVDDSGNLEAKGLGRAEIIVTDVKKRVESKCRVVVTDPVAGISLNKKSIGLAIGQTITITATTIPETAAPQEIVWQSSDESIATVNNGTITGKKSGTTEIIASTKDGKFKAKCQVTVAYPITGISLDEKSISLAIGQSRTLTATVSPKSASNQELVWQSSNESIATVKNGTVTAKKSGTSEITVSTKDGKIKAKCQVTVASPVTSISLNPTSLTMELSQRKTISVVITPSNATNSSITWSSSDSSIATVSNGTITPKKKGTVTITAKSSNGKTASAKVTIVNNTNNKTAIFFGDSITMGKYGNYSWANYIGEKYDLKSFVNAGLSGGVISDTRDGYWIENVVRQYKVKSFDYVIMHGGINDVSRRTAMGSYNANDFSGNYNTKTFIGGLEHYIYTVKKQWPNAKLGYIINYSTPIATSVYEYENQYYSKIKEVLKKWNVSYFDLYSGVAPNGKTYSNLLQVNTTTYLPDGVHLSREGYNLISPYIYNWMNTL